MQQQQLIAACLRRSVRELFTDVPPGGRTPEPPEEVVEHVAVPNLIGKERSALEQELAAVGLRLGDAREARRDDVPAGKVADQTPSAGQQVARDTTVTVTVSTGPTE